MRWFKHMSDSHTDEKLAMVQAELGFEGYGLYWFLLEVIAKQMDAENDKTFVEYPTNFWQRLTGLYPNKFKRLVNVLEKFELLSANFCKKSIRIDCPNLLKYRDEWSKKKGRNSGVTPERLRSKETDTETEKEEEEEKNPPNPPAGGLPDGGGFGGLGDKKRKSKSRALRDQEYSKSFLAFWARYPRKTAKGYAWECWQKIGQAGGVTVPQIMAGLEQQLARGAFSAEPDKIPHPSTWLNQRRWEDDPPAQGPREPPGAEAVELTPEQEEAMFGPGWQGIYSDKGERNAA